jgi:Domain of unknown function (DUF4406)
MGLKVVYIAGKYRGKTHCGKSYTEIHGNIMLARAWAIKIIDLGGCITLTPHLNSMHMELDGKNDPAFWYKADIELLRRCDAIFMLPNWMDSRGAIEEKNFAEKYHIPVFTELDALDHWLHIDKMPFEHGA